VKAQYVGDIGDFGKVLLLKCLASLGFKIGINWILTGKSKNSDGKHRDYAAYGPRECLCCCDEEIFNRILPLARKEGDQRAIEDLEAIIRSFSRSTVFFSKEYKSGKTRADTEAEALTMLAPSLADLVFFDPDNGIGRIGGTSSKHVYYADLRRYWERGQSVLVYHHLSHETPHAAQIDLKKSELESELLDSKVYSYWLRRGTARVYFLCVQPAHLMRIREHSTFAAIEPLIVIKREWRRKVVCRTTH
jgi:hypothetical protein